jgi:hypothetical protein
MISTWGCYATLSVPQAWRPMVTWPSLTDTPIVPATRDIGIQPISPHNAPPLPLSSRPKSGHNITAWFNMTLLQDSGLQAERRP